MKIGLWGYYGNNNYGDDLLEKLAVSKIDTVNNKLYIFSSGKTKFNLPENAEYIAHSPLSFLKRAFSLDLLIIGPGGLFPSRRILRLMYYILVMSIMKTRRKKCILYGLGIGNGNFKNSFSKFLFNLIFKLSDKSVLRQDISEYFDSDFCKKHNIVQTYDMILTRHSLFADSTNNEKKKSITFCPANIIPPKNTNLYNEFLSDVQDTVEKLISDGYTVNLIALSPEDDKPLAMDIFNKFDGNNITYTEYSPETTSEIFRIVGESTAVIAMRFHALITAIQLGTPAYCIAYSDKTEDICKRFGINELCQRVCFSKKSYYEEIIPLDKDHLIDKLQYITDNSENIVATTSEHMKKLQNETDIHYDLMKIIEEINI